MALQTTEISTDGLSLDAKFAVEQGQKFFPITHRKAIMGLSVNTLTLSESLDIEVNETDNIVSINPIVQEEFTRIDNTIIDLSNTINQQIGTEINNLWNKVNNINYAGSTEPGGAANSALKLDTARTINITGAETGSTSFDGSSDITIDLTVNHTHSEYALTTHDHDTVYSKLDHTHLYAGSDSAGGVATSANKLATARTITLSGAVTGSVSFDGSANITISTAVNHTHSYLPLTGGTLTGTVVMKDVTLTDGYHSRLCMQAFCESSEIHL